MFVFFSLISFFFFFFSSRRRHTRYIGDWSSDVCSSDLTMFYDRMRAQAGSPELKNYIDTHKTRYLALLAQNRVRPRLLLLLLPRQENRRKRAGLLRRNLNRERQNRLCRNNAVNIRVSHMQ